MNYTDKILRCRECGAEFLFSAGEQEFYASKGFQHEPSRCRPCRNARRQAAAQVTAVAQAQPTNSGNSRQLYATVCASCGGEALIPFIPRTQKPVYCQSCFEKQRVARTS